MGAKLLNKVKRPGKKIQKSCVEEEFSHSGKKKKKLKHQKFMLLSKMLQPKKIIQVWAGLTQMSTK